MPNNAAGFRGNGGANGRASHANTRNLIADYEEKGVYSPCTFWVSFLYDFYGVERRHTLRIDCVRWSTDFPLDNVWSHSRRQLTHLFKGHSAE